MTIKKKKWLRICDEDDNKKENRTKKRVRGREGEQNERERGRIKKMNVTQDGWERIRERGRERKRERLCCTYRKGGVEGERKIGRYGHQREGEVRERRGKQMERSST